MEERAQKITAILTVFFILGFGIYFVFNPKKEFSENENRYLEKTPIYSFDNLKSGKYISSLESYFTDHFPLRDNFMGLKASYQRILQQTEINGVYIGKDEYLLEEYKNPLNTKKLIDKLNEFYNKNNVDMFFMLVPSSGLINADKNPNFIDFSLQETMINEIYHNLDFKGIDVISSLREGKKQNQMYYRLDHHWTSEGAYYGYLAFCKANNLEPVSLEQYQRTVVTSDFNGTLYSKTNIYSYKPDEITTYTNNQKYQVNYVNSNRITDTLYEEKHLNTKDKYAYFLDGNHPLITIDSSIKNGKEILIIKDSYANSFVPFLMNHYDKIHIVDLRFYNSSVTDYIKENNIDQVLFLYSVMGIDDDLGIYKIR